MFAVASNRLSLNQVQKMLSREIDTLPSSAHLALPHGLYLTNVDYHDEDLNGATDDVTKLPVAPVQDPVQARFNLIDWFDPKIKEVMRYINNYKRFSKINPNLRKNDAFDIGSYELK